MCYCISMKLTYILLSLVSFSFCLPSLAWNNKPAKPWDKLEDCVLVDSYGNDGDSFHIKHKSKEYVFRLYFVDCAETSMTYMDRVQHQADWWGISTKDTIRAGKDATAFTMKLLKNNKFVVYTKYTDARGQTKLGREFAMIKIGDSYLSQLLVKNGLARVYGYPIKTPEGISAKAFRSQLDSMEKKAKRERKGAWHYAEIDFFKKSKEIRNAHTSDTKDIEGTPLTLKYPVALYSDDPSVSFRGTLRTGTKIYVLGNVGRDMIKVRTPFHGDITSGQCRRYDIDDMTKN